MLFCVNDTALLFVVMIILNELTCVYPVVYISRQVNVGSVIKPLRESCKPLKLSQCGNSSKFNNDMPSNGFVYFVIDSIEFVFNIRSPNI